LLEEREGQKSSNDRAGECLGPEQYHRYVGEAAASEIKTKTR